ncbi:MAG TPA: serine--tRNA ligase [Candidatus Nanoarchaeia archaeon]|nr:serine--tRNA ligase [Candidatus Nanoarchaeia archaeon]
MISIDFIRENPEAVKENIKKKFQEDKLPLVDEVLKLDEKWRKIKYEEDNLRKERNNISKEINKKKKSQETEEAENLIKKAKSIPEKIEKFQKQRKDLKEKIDEIMYKIPNIIHHSVPVGKDDSENVEQGRYGKVKEFDFTVKNHIELGEELGMLDFDTSSDVSGKGFYYLRGDLALLNQAMINFARDFMVEKEFEYVEPPLLIREDVLKGVYSNEEIEQMSYKIADEDLYLIATSEHPMIGQFINSTIRAKDLPIKQTAYSMCFRKEIGSHGIDEKGLFRTHQFNKQEMIVLCEPEDSYKWYDEMLNHSVEFFKKLEVPIRVLESCSGDLADLKAKGCDLEAWSPRQKDYFEITSLSNMEAAQARRLNIKVEGKGERYYAHTLNNTVVATSRAMVAIMENHQNKDGSINIPKALQPYMNGKKKIISRKKDKKE